MENPESLIGYGGDLVFNPVFHLIAQGFHHRNAFILIGVILYGHIEREKQLVVQRGGDGPLELDYFPPVGPGAEGVGTAFHKLAVVVFLVEGDL